MNQIGTGTKMNQIGKSTQCSDYKVRYCCAKRKFSFWDPWTPWSECGATCGGGNQRRTRDCRNKGPAGCLGQSVQMRKCNRADCPGKYWEDNYCP